MLSEQSKHIVWYAVGIRKNRKKIHKNPFYGLWLNWRLSTSQGHPAKGSPLRVTYRTIWGRPEDVRTFFGNVLRMSSGRNFSEWAVEWNGFRSNVCSELWRLKYTYSKKIPVHSSNKNIRSLNIINLVQEGSRASFFIFVSWALWLSDIN